MKYYLKFEGNERLLVKAIIIFQIIITILLIVSLVKENPIDIRFTDEQLQMLCQKE